MLPREMVSNVRTINISSKLLHNLLNDLLDFSKMVANSFSIDRIEIEIRPFLEETFDL
jgi:signal transduction histidine kinase